MKKLCVVAFLALLWPWRLAQADPITGNVYQIPASAVVGTTPHGGGPSESPLSVISDNFSTSFLSHISVVDSFRGGHDGSHVIKLSDGIFQMIPYKSDHLLIGSLGVIPSPSDSTKFYKSYTIHAHLLSVIGKYMDINPSYAPILQDIELTPGYTYDTDQRHGAFVFDVGFTHKFGGPTQ